ncbi:MAG: CDP-alcohol phosphatidyltransferase family protein [Clostridia bacterium]|nr:CDP-alcohol phosphatidyltransferase family protein [Clostridia bacterium]
MKHIPNILSTIRLFAIPVFVYAYFNLSPYVAAVIYVAAWLTDALDGYLARRFNWITDIGKLLDPLADKLMQITAAVCFTIDNLLFLAVLIPLLIKELAMLIGGMLVIKRQKVVAQAVWYGKLATVVIFVSAFVRLLVRDCLAVDIAVCAVILTMLVFSLLMYYFKIFRGKYNETIRKQ